MQRKRNLRTAIARRTFQDQVPNFHRSQLEQPTRPQLEQPQTRKISFLGAPVDPTALNPNLCPNSSPTTGDRTYCNCGTKFAGFEQNSYRTCNKSINTSDFNN